MLYISWFQNPICIGLKELFLGPLLASFSQHSGWLTQYLPAEEEFSLKLQKKADCLAGMVTSETDHVINTVLSHIPSYLDPLTTL